jgi:hypothetical protein
MKIEDAVGAASVTTRHQDRTDGSSRRTSDLADIVMPVADWIVGRAGGAVVQRVNPCSVEAFPSGS